ncbi:hypothetical protein D3C78_622730 [compost metagenome]
MAVSAASSVALSMNPQGCNSGYLLADVVTETNWMSGLLTAGRNRGILLSNY